MYRILGVCAFALSFSLLAACATPSVTKEASRLQLEAFDGTRQSVASYSAIVAKEIQAIQSLRRASQDLEAVAVVVESVATEDIEPTDALDRLTNELKKKRKELADRDDPLQALLKEHKASMKTLRDLLGLLEQNQALIDRYLNTDLGPTAEQITGLREGLETLKAAGAGGGP